MTRMAWKTGMTRVTGMSGGTMMTRMIVITRI